MTRSPLRIGALVSGGGTNLKAVIDACADGRIEGCVVFVGSDNPEAFGLARAEKSGIPTFVTDYAKIRARLRTEAGHPPPPPGAQTLSAHSSMARAACSAIPPTAIIPEKLARVPKPIKPDFARMGTAQKDETIARTFAEKARMACEAALLEAMSPYSFDLLILAGFMRLLSPWFIDRVNTDPALPRIMNIHPALLPAFPGTDGYGDTFRHGCKVGGCTVHFVDYGEDTGPIIGQKAFPIDPSDTLETVKAKGLALEWELYPECINLFAQNRLKLEIGANGRKVVKIIT